MVELGVAFVVFMRRAGMQQACMQSRQREDTVGFRMLRYSKDAALPPCARVMQNILQQKSETFSDTGV